MCFSGGSALLDRPCMVFQRVVCVCTCDANERLSAPSICFCLCFLYVGSYLLI